LITDYPLFEPGFGPFATVLILMPYRHPVLDDIPASSFSIVYSESQKNENDERRKHNHHHQKNV
jgi:hypothetical protein